MARRISPGGSEGEAFHRMVVGLLPKFPGDNTDDLAVMERRLELFHVEHRGGDGVGRDMAFPSGLSRALADEAQHALHVQQWFPHRGQWVE